MNLRRRISLLLLFGLFACKEPSPEALGGTARSFLQTLGYEVIGASCADRDSDGDGYVSCTARVKEAAEPLALECASFYSPTSGCRMQKPGSGRRGR